MSYFQIVHGLFYTICSGPGALGWSASGCDVASPKDRPALAVSDTQPVFERPPFGLVAFQCGLHTAQRVSEATWATKVPHEFHLRRRPVDENGHAWPGEKLSDMAFSKYKREMRFRLRVQYIAYSHAGGLEFTAPRVIDLHATCEFREVTLDSMMSHNQPNEGAGFVALDSVGSDAVQSVLDNVPKMHPKYFHTIAPNDDVSVRDALKLGFRVSMKPAEGISRRALAEWFDPLLPRDVRTNLASENGPKRDQEIEYDF